MPLRPLFFSYLKIELKYLLFKQLVVEMQR